MHTNNYENGIPNRNPLVTGVTSASQDCFVCKPAWDITQYWTSLSEEKYLARFASWYLCDAFLHHWVSLVMKTPEDVAIKA